MQSRLSKMCTTPMCRNDQQQHSNLEGSREVGLAVGNCKSEVSGPGDKLFQEVLKTPEEREASFKGLLQQYNKCQWWVKIILAKDYRLQESGIPTYLDDNPNTSTEQSNWPCNEPKDDEPQDSENRVLGHVCSCSIQFKMLLFCVQSEDEDVDNAGNLAIGWNQLPACALNFKYG